MWFAQSFFRCLSIRLNKLLNLFPNDNLIFYWLTASFTQITCRKDLKRMHLRISESYISSHRVSSARLSHHLFWLSRSLCWSLLHAKLKDCHFRVSPESNQTPELQRVGTASWQCILSPNLSSLGCPFKAFYKWNVGMKFLGLCRVKF